MILKGRGLELGNVGRGNLAAVAPLIFRLKVLVLGRGCT